MSEIRKCAACGEPRYQHGAGAHVELGTLAAQRRYEELHVPPG